MSSKSYQKGSYLEGTIKKDIDKLKDFELVDWGKSALAGQDITKRELNMVIPNRELLKSQIDVINNAIDYGKQNGVDIRITIGKD